MSYLSENKILYENLSDKKSFDQDLDNLEKGCSQIQKSKIEYYENTKNRSFNMISDIYLILLNAIAIIPVSCCDLYFAINEESCLNNINYTGITLYQYLVVSGSYSLTTFTTILILTSCFYKNILSISILSNSINTQIYYICYTINNTFLLSWTILGLFIYSNQIDVEGYTDNTDSTCSYNLYTYMIVQFILKIIYIICSICFHFI